MKMLKELRKSRSKTQSQVAKEIGILQQTYSRYENGKNQPDFLTLKRIADYFNTTTDYLLGVEHNLIRKPIILNNGISLPIKDLRNLSSLNKTINDAHQIPIFEIPLCWIEGNAEDYFLCYSMDETMSGSCINKNSLLLVKKIDRLEKNEIGVVQFNNQVMIRRLWLDNECRFLLSTNLQCEPIVIRENDDFKILGKVIMSINKID